VLLFTFVVLPFGFWWYRKARRSQLRSIQESLVILHAEHQRQRAEAEETENQVMDELQALPMQTWETQQEGDSTEADCVLCLETFKADDELRVLPCKHYFHKDCIDKMFASRRFRPRSCPNCRSNPLASVSGDSSLRCDPSAPSEATAVSEIFATSGESTEVRVEDVEENDVASDSAAPAGCLRPPESQDGGKVAWAGGSSSAANTTSAEEDPCTTAAGSPPTAIGRSAASINEDDQR